MVRAYRLWLLSILVLVAGIVVIGGLTRLTGSGLSMVDWQPIAGILPPITNAQWQQVFLAYQASPEYLEINKGMGLSEFKFIFFWEYIHRIIGRIIGLVAIIPFIYFLFKRHLTGSFIIQWCLVIALIGGQGLLGWYMVKSGLEGSPYVSHFRLAAHLSLAFLIYAIVLWHYLKHQFLLLKSKGTIITKLTQGLIIIVTIQIIYGAFTAGLHGGQFYNTYPKMGPDWFPQAALMYDNFIQNILNNPIMIQWIHRWLAVVLIFGGLIIFRHSLNRPSLHLQYSSLLLLFSICIQFILGILTLITAVWIPVASAHQFGALVLLSSMVMVLYFSKYTTHADAI